MTKDKLDKLDKLWWKAMQLPLGCIIMGAIRPLPPKEYARRVEMNSIMSNLVEKR